jgi:hypothetical protein
MINIIVLSGYIIENSYIRAQGGILTQLIFLIVAAMLLINVVILNLYEKDLVTAKEKPGSCFYQA